MTTCIIVDKTGMLKESTIKEYSEEELYKKCGFKKADGFNMDTNWTIKIDKEKYNVRLYGKTTGRANSENKYDFPPPSDNTLFFGSCLLIGFRKNESVPCNLTMDMWTKMYEKLFGGFEDLAATAAEDETEEDELANVPKKYKTKSGYLKDGFIVSDNEEIESGSASSSIVESESGDVSSEHSGELSEDLVLEDITSELDEEEYDYDNCDEVE